MGLFRLIFAAILFVSSIVLVIVSLAFGALVVLPIMVVFFIVFMYFEAKKEGDKEEYYKADYEHSLRHTERLNSQKIITPEELEELSAKAEELLSRPIGKSKSDE